MMVTPECLLRIVSRRGVEVFAYGSMTPPAAVTDVMDVANITNSNISNTCSEQQQIICRDDREVENGIKVVFFVVVGIVGTILIVSCCWNSYCLLLFREVFVSLLMAYFATSTLKHV